jgi:N-acyl-D-aspartate/D-glutamate deacylase
MRSQGIEYTVVNGAITWENGALTGASSGEVLRS